MYLPSDTPHTCFHGKVQEQDDVGKRPSTEIGKVPDVSASMVQMTVTNDQQDEVELTALTRRAKGLGLQSRCYRYYLVFKFEMS